MTTFSVREAGNVTANIDTADELIELIKMTIGNLLTELSQDRLAEILVAMIKLIPVSAPATTVNLSYVGNILTVTVNGVSASVNINPAGTLYQYDAGFGMYVRATSVGVGFTYTTGLGTVTIPPGVKLLSSRLHGSAGYLDLDNTFSIKYDGFVGVSDKDNIYPPDIVLYDRILDTSPSAIIPWTYVYNASPQPQIVGVGLNFLTIKLINLDAYLNWGIKVTF